MTIKKNSETSRPIVSVRFDRSLLTDLTILSIETGVDKSTMITRMIQHMLLPYNLAATRSIVKYDRTNINKPVETVT